VVGSLTGAGRADAVARRRPIPHLARCRRKIEQAAARVAHTETSLEVVGSLTGAGRAEAIARCYRVPRLRRRRRKIEQAAPRVAHAETSLKVIAGTAATVRRAGTRTVVAPCIANLRSLELTVAAVGCRTRNTGTAAVADGAGNHPVVADLRNEVAVVANLRALQVAVAAGRDGAVVGAGVSTGVRPSLDICNAHKPLWHWRQLPSRKFSRTSGDASTPS
jgi:sirohydrochlorin ferrochelatase